MIARWLIRCTVVVAAIVLCALAARELPGLAVLLALLCGLAGLDYLVARVRGMPPQQPEQERDKNERFLRDVPPPSGG